MLKLFKNLTKFERLLWISSLAIVSGAFIISKSNDVLTLIASLIGVTALIFVAKGYVIGQVLTVIFAVFYGIISFYFKYYGEMITYLAMTAPIAVVTVLSWIKHPYKKTKEVRVNKLSFKLKTIMIISSIVTTTIFYFILKALNNNNLMFSTISITTSFLASYLTLFRSPYYALAYASNDIVLIILWVLASLENKSYIPMIICFIMFFINDMYGFINWKKMEKRQIKNM